MEATERGRPVVAGVHAGALGYWVCSSCLKRKLHGAVASWCRLVVPGVDDASCKGVGRAGCGASPELFSAEATPSSAEATTWWGKEQKKWMQGGRRARQGTRRALSFF